MDEEPRRSAIVKVRVHVGSDGEAYYTAVYANGELGPRSEGYHAETPERARRLAIEAAVRDFPGLPVQMGYRAEASE